KNISEAQIKEILLLVNLKKKEKVLESYIKISADTKPQWFFKNLKEIEKFPPKSTHFIVL
ncbi:4251_t:CDS:2, partial [Gigaspora rosea]